MNLTRLTQEAAQPTVAVAPTSIAIGSVGAVATDAAGNVYFSSNPDAIFKLNNQGTLTRIAGTGIAGYSGDGGPATQAQLNFPLSYPELVTDPYDFSELVGGLAADAAGNIYIADAYDDRVRRIDPNGIITTVANYNSRTWPQGVAVDSANNLYVTTGELLKITPAGVVTSLAQANCHLGFLGSGLCIPEEIAVDSKGNVFVPDAGCRVREVKPDGSIFTVTGDDQEQDQTCGYFGDGVLATKAVLAFPYSVAVDASGNLYIADTFNNCIRKVDSTGIIHTIAGVCVSFTAGAYAGDGGPATSAQLNRPHGVAVDATGNVYIADTYNNRLRKVDTSGIITTIAGNGTAQAISTTTVVGPAFTGSWYDPTQSGHGLILEMLPNNRLFATWFAFNPAGDQQAWFDGVGTYNGNTATVAAVEQLAGGSWIPNFNPSAIVRNSWGMLTFTFSDCNHGKVDFNSGLGYSSGTMNLTRLTLPAGLTCP
jgi:sugar lactone lactonase YvrE